MAFDLNDGLVEFLQYQRHGFQRVAERRLDGGLVDVEGDVARHDQFNFVTIAYNANTGTLEFAAQLRFLLIHVITDTTTNGRTGCGTNQCAFATVTAAGGCSADGGTTNGPDNAAFRGARGFFLTGVRIVCHTAAKTHGGDGKSYNRFLHGILQSLSKV